MLEDKVFVEDFVIAIVAVPFILLYAFGMFKFVSLGFYLIHKFFEALELRVEDWIYKFKKGE